MKYLNHKRLGPALRLLAGLALIAGTSSFAHAADNGADTGWHGKAEAPHYQEQIFPPWQHGANDDVLDKGLRFTVPEVKVPPAFIALTSMPGGIVTTKTWPLYSGCSCSKAFTRGATAKK